MVQYRTVVSPPPVALRPNAGHGLLILEFSRSHTTTHTVGRTPSEAWLVRRRNLYLTTHNTNNRHPCPGGIRTRNLSRWAAVVPRLISCGHWDRHRTMLVVENSENGWSQLTVRSISYCCIQGCDAVHSDTILATFRRNLLPISSFHSPSYLPWSCRYYFRLICPYVCNKPCCISSQNHPKGSLKNLKFHITINYSI